MNKAVKKLRKLKDEQDFLLEKLDDAIDELEEDSYSEDD